MKIFSAVRQLSRFEKLLWAVSVFFTAVSFALSGGQGILTFCASLIGVTALIFVAKGEPLGQLLTIVFSLLYGIISLRSRYYGEMMTYLGMTAPIAAASLVSWLKHPAREGETQVKIERISPLKTIMIFLISAVVTFVFYFILKYFDTASLYISTLSVFTSFSACALLLARSPFYALAYASNDIVLIMLWVIASFADISNIPMIMCFIMFLINDLYGFINWRRILERQQISV